MTLSTLFVLAILAPVRFVDVNSSPGGNGTTWSQAYDTLADAIADQSATEIRVADGTYETASLPLRDGLAIIGGYGGETVLDSTIIAKGYRRFVADGADNVRLQRLTIVDAEEGAIQLLNGGSLAVRDCRFTDNGTEHSGGCIYSEGADISVFGCVFEDNYCRWFGGCIYVSDARLTAIACTFREARSLSGHGGALAMQYSDSLILGCRFISCGGEGGGAIATATVDALIVGCDFIDNRVSLDGGAAMLLDFSHITVVGCRFIGNQNTWVAPRGIIQARGTTQAALLGCYFFGNTEPLTMATEQAVIKVWPPLLLP